MPSIKHSSLFPNRLIFPFFILLSDINSSELRFVINALNAFDALKIETKSTSIMQSEEGPQDEAL